MADWIQSALLTVHGRLPDESHHRRSRRKGRSDDKPFDQILTSAAQHEGESEGSGSNPFTSSTKNSGVSRRGKKGGRSRAHAYSETPMEPTHAYSKQYRDMNNTQHKMAVKMADHLDIHLQQQQQQQQQQHLSDSDAEPTGCLGAAQRMLSGCYTSRRTEQRIRAQADQRYYEF
ncbi:hypothetical protein AALO_G00181660 [Alosa alosa]|uniref:Uncharacterized protein n=1 Tax=Alosa alosa TaxID=278164 RepID=A0AAV6GDY9_9TELE|nr:hypothetical protein AALO_G00181660 [Alosa alosa]